MLFGGIILAVGFLVACECNNQTSPDEEPVPPEMQITVGFEDSYIEVNEEGHQLSLMVSLSQELTDPLAIEISTMADTAITPNDYTSLAPGSRITLLPGETHAVVEISIVDDSIREETENFMVILTLIDIPPDNLRLDNDSLTIAILDNDTHEVSLLPIPPIWEDQGEVVITIRLSQPLEEDLLLHVFTVDNLALSPSDYTARPRDSLIVIPTGSRTAEVSIPIIEDALPEDNEDFTVGIDFVEEPPPMDVILLEASNSVVILDNDKISVGFTESTIRVDENTGEIQFTVTLSRSRSEPLILGVIVTNGTALASDDYIALPPETTVVIPNGETEEIVEIAIVDDRVFEFAEYFIVKLTSRGVPLPNDVRFYNTSVVVFIEDDDSATVGFTNLDFRVNEGAGAAVLTVASSRPLDEEVILGVTTVNDTAVALADYTPLSLNATVIIPEGTSEVTLEIPIIDDEIGEGVENFAVRLREIASLPDGVRLVDHSAVVTIDDDDDMLIVGFESSAKTIEEERGTLQLVVRLLEGTLKQALTLGVITIDGDAEAPADYAPLAPDRTLAIAPGQTRAILNITIENDRLTEGDESFTVTLEPEAASLPEGLTYDNRSVQITIIDNDHTTVGFTTPEFRFDEGVSSASLTVVFSEPRDLPAPVRFEVSLIPGTAVTPDDYETPSMSMEVTIPMGYNTSGTVEIPIREDGIIEGDEYFTARLTPRSGMLEGGVTFRHSSARIIIVDNDTKVGFASPALRVREDVRTLGLMVNLSGVRLEDNLELIATTADGMALSPEDYDSLPATLVIIPAGRIMSSMVEIHITDTERIEGDEEFTVHLNPIGMHLPPGVEFEHQSITVTIEDNATVGFDSSAVNIPEKDEVLRLPVRLSGGILLENLELSASTASGTALATEDYTPLSATPVVILAEETGTTLEIAIANTPTGPEGDEDFTIRLDVAGGSLPPGVEFEHQSVTVTIQETPTIGFTSTTYTAREDDGELRLVVTLSDGRLLNQPVTLNLEFVDGTATRFSDYQVIEESITIEAGVESIVSLVGIRKDVSSEDEESFSVILSPVDSLPPNVRLGIKTAIITLLSDD